MPPTTPLGFGGLERIVSPRDFELGAYQPPEVIPDVFLPNLGALDVYNQSTYPTCGAHAGAFFDSKLQSDRQGTVKTLSPKYLWANIKQIDGFPLSDGTDMTSIFKSLVAKGDCDLSLLSNALDTSLESYSKIGNVAPAMLANGAQNLIRNYAFTNNPSFLQLKQAIYRNKAVLALIDIGDGFWLPDWKHVLPIKLGNKVGHHFIVLWGYDSTRIWFRNSWSRDWGINGDGYFEQSYVPHVLEIGTALVLPFQFIFTRDMQYGDSNNDVTQLQRRLGVIDSGWYGPLTKAAVMKYQTINNIISTGYCGPLTRTRLNVTI